MKPACEFDVTLVTSDSAPRRGEFCPTHITARGTFGVMRIEEIWRFPVKSVGGEPLATATVDEFGIDGDRAWGIYDPSTELVLTARREPRLLFLTAHLVDGEPLIATDDGVELGDDAALSAWLGRPVELCRAGSGTATFENPMDIEHESDWVRWESVGDTFHDGRSKISLVSNHSLGEWDHRRFRINLITDGHDENDLTGDVSIGTAVVTIRQPITRCIMITRAQPGVDRDVSVLKRVIAEHDNLMGIGGVVTTPGVVAVGDEVIQA